MLRLSQLISLHKGTICARSIVPVAHWKGGGGLDFETSRVPALCNVNTTPSRRSYSSYYGSRTEESPDKYTDWEKSYDEWKFVEKLVPPVYVAQPPTDSNIELPSGWKPPNPPNDCLYSIRRTKNHQVPVYVQIKDQGLTRKTFIRRVEGNIWQLEKDIGFYLKQIYPKKVIVTKCLELQRSVVVIGDYCDDVMQWAKDQGF